MQNVIIKSFLVSVLFFLSVSRCPVAQRQLLSQLVCTSVCRRDSNCFAAQNHWNQPVDYPEVQWIWAKVPIGTHLHNRAIKCKCVRRRWCGSQGTAFFCFDWNNSADSFVQLRSIRLAVPFQAEAEASFASFSQGVDGLPGLPGPPGPDGLTVGRCTSLFRILEVYIKCLLTVLVVIYPSF